jgi:hypothetical protein
VIVLDFIEDGSAQGTPDSEAGRQGVSPQFGGAAAGMAGKAPPAEDSIDHATETAVSVLPEEERPPVEEQRPTSTIDESHPMEEERSRRRRKRRVRLSVWTVVVAALLVGLFVGARIYLGNQWYVGVAGDRVAVYNGIPTEVLGIELSHVEETTNIPVTPAEQLGPWRGLREGITAESLEAARQIVTQIRRDVSQSPGERAG